MQRTIGPVHGFWLGERAWDDVRPILEAAGHRVIAPTRPGNGPGADRTGVGLSAHIDFVTAFVDSVEGDVVLVGHSAGGAVVHGIVDRRLDRVARRLRRHATPPRRRAAQP